MDVTETRCTVIEYFEDGFELKVLIGIRKRRAVIFADYDCSFWKLKFYQHPVDILMKLFYHVFLFLFVDIELNYHVLELLIFEIFPQLKSKRNLI
jgi:hypothetical protein